MKTSHALSQLASWFLLFVPDRSGRADDAADLIVHHGKIVTVDRDFSIRQALAVKEGRVSRSARMKRSSRYADQTRSSSTSAGKMVLPGLIDSHTHPTDACMIEAEHPIPAMETITDVLDYIHARADAVGPGRWVIVRQVFITRLEGAALSDPR